MFRDQKIEVNYVLNNVEVHIYILKFVGNMRGFLVQVDLLPHIY